MKENKTKLPIGKIRILSTHFGANEIFRCGMDISKCMEKGSNILEKQTSDFFSSIDRFQWRIQSNFFLFLLCLSDTYLRKENYFKLIITLSTIGKGKERRIL